MNNHELALEVEKLLNDYERVKQIDSKTIDEIERELSALKHWIQYAEWITSRHLGTNKK